MEVVRVSSAGVLLDVLSLDLGGIPLVVVNIFAPGALRGGARGRVLRIGAVRGGVLGSVVS